MAANTVTINGQRITWAFIQKIKLACGGDWDTTMDCFYKARNATGRPDAIVRYIACGFRRSTAGVRYMLQPSKEFERGEMGKQVIRAWWRDTVHSPKHKPMSMADIFSAISKGNQQEIDHG
jgi:hypothetical protein